MSEENLDAAIAAAKATKAAPVWGRATAAAEESARRNPNTSLWTDRRRHVGYWPFYLDKNTSIDAVVLSSPHIFVVHKYIIGWNEGNGNYFPENWYGLCDKWRLPDDPEQAGFAPTGKPCLACRTLGEPKSIVVLPIAFKREWSTKQGAQRTYKWQLRALIVDQAGATNQLRDLASTQPHRDLKFCLLKISRSGNERAPRIGDAFTVLKIVTEAQVMGTKDIADQMAEFSAAKAWAPFTPEHAMAALLLHKRFSDKKNEGADYDHKAMEAVIRGEPDDDGIGLGGEPAAKSARGSRASAASSVSSLDDLDGSDVEAEPSFDELTTETKAPPAAEPAKSTAAPTKATKTTAPTSAPTDDPWA